MLGSLLLHLALKFELDLNLSFENAKKKKETKPPGLNSKLRA